MNSDMCTGSCIRMYLSAHVYVRTLEECPSYSQMDTVAAN